MKIGTKPGVVHLCWSGVLRRLARRGVGVAAVEHLAAHIVGDKLTDLAQHRAPVGVGQHQPARRTDESRRVQHSRGLTAMREELLESLDLPLRVQVTSHLRKHAGHVAGLAHVIGEPVVLGELAITPPPPPSHARIEAVAGAVQTGDDRRCEGVDLAERVRDTATRRRVFEMAGISDEHPARTGRLTGRTPPSAASRRTCRRAWRPRARRQPVRSCIHTP